MHFENQKPIFWILGQQQIQKLSLQKPLASFKSQVLAQFNSFGQVLKYVEYSCKIVIKANYLLECNVSSDQIISGVFLSHKVKFQKVQQNFTQNKTEVSSSETKKQLGIMFSLGSKSFQKSQVVIDLSQCKKIKLFSEDKNTLLNFFSTLHECGIIQKTEEFKKMFIPKRKIHTYPCNSIFVLDKLNHKQFLLKCYSKAQIEEECSLEQFEHRLEVLHKLQCTGWVQPLKIFQSSNSLYIISKFLVLNLQQYILSMNQINWKSIQNIIGQLLKIIQYLHHNGITHGKIQPRTILLKHQSGYWNPIFSSIQFYMTYYNKNASNNSLTMESQNNNDLQEIFFMKRAQDLQMLANLFLFMIIRDPSLLNKSTSQISHTSKPQDIFDEENPEFNTIPTTAKQLLFALNPYNYQNMPSIQNILQQSFFKQEF